MLKYLLTTLLALWVSIPATFAITNNYTVKVDSGKAGFAQKVNIVKDGKILKSFTAWNVKYSENKKYLLVDANPAKTAVHTKHTRVLYNHKGEVKWQKTFVTYPAHEEDEAWEEGICADGSVSYVTYRDSMYVQQLTTVFIDSLGNEIYRIKHSYYNGNNISVDGKYFSCITHKENDKYRYSLVIDIYNNRCRYIKSEGKDWLAWISLEKSNRLIKDKILVNWRMTNSDASGILYFIYDELPDDFSTVIPKQ